mgnify:CR=1 FL=1
MALGRKTGGRSIGTPNKRTAEVAEKLAALGCDPIMGMAQLALDVTVTPELRGRLLAELAGYLHPKRRAVEVKNDEGPKVTFHLHTGPQLANQQGKDV